MRRRDGVKWALGVMTCVFGLVGCKTPSQVATGPAAATPELAPRIADCPSGVPAETVCRRGTDSAGAPYLIAVPKGWQGVLVVHSHGGPNLGEPSQARADEDLKRWAVTLREGYAWAGSVFRQGGFAVTAAAEDTERVRQIFVRHVAQPRRTLLHGQSWGAMVATRAAELYPASWDGILLTSGVVAGPASYDFRLDLRVVYQALCQNHPRASEPAYPLAIGLPADAKMTHADLLSRMDACLGLKRPAAERTAEQAKNLRQLLAITQLPERSLIGHMTWATWTLQDIARRTGGTGPFGNEGVLYRGADDVNFNAKVARYPQDRAAAARFTADTDHQGRFKVPALTTHGLQDSTVFVKGQAVLRARMEQAGTSAQLVQTFVDASEHSYLGDAIYPPLFEALLRWVDAGTKPTPAGIAQRCEQLRAPDQAGGCRFVPGYVL